MTDVLDIGDQPVFKAEFTDIYGTPADPTTILITLMHPDATEEEFDQTDCTNPDVGEWWFTAPTMDECGIWALRFQGTAGVVSSAEKQWRVQSGRIG